MLDALYSVVQDTGVALQDCLIFLPSRRAVRAAEKMFVEKNGGAIILPQLVALGEGIDDVDITEYEDSFSNFERVILLTKLFSQNPHLRFPNNLGIARNPAQ